MGRTVTGGEFRERVDAVFMALTAKDSPHGSLTWFARQNPGLTRQTVWRWSTGQHRINPSALVVLRQLEREADGKRGPAGWIADAVADGPVG